MVAKKKKTETFKEKALRTCKKKTCSCTKYVYEHKKIFKRTGTLLLSLLLILFVIYFTSVQVKLLFDTETYITLSPSINSITLDEKQATNITFTTQVEHIGICDVYCTYTLIEANTQTIISNETLLAPKEKTSTIQVELPEIGSGQLIYNYEVTCTTTEKTFCPSKGKTYKKTAFLTMNYPLSEEEKILRKQTLPLLEEQIKKFTELQLIYNQTQEQINLLQTYARTNLTQNILLLLSVIDYLTIDEEYILNLWEKQLFQESKEELNKFKKSLFLLEERLEQQEKATKKEIEELKLRQDILKELLIQKEKINKQTNILPIHNQSLYQAIVQANSNLTKIQEEQKKYTTSEQLHQVRKTQKLFKEINETYAAIREQQVQEEKDLMITYKQILTNMSQTFSHINCTNIQEVEEIISNYDALYNTTTNTSVIYNYTNYFCTTQNNSFFTQNITEINFTIRIEDVPITSIPSPQAQCTYKEKTVFCGSEKQTPLVLVHGHSFSKATPAELAFTRLLYLQESLAQDGYINAGTLGIEANINSVPPEDWSQNPAPIVIAVTYYYLQHYDLGTLSFTTRKTDRIENYAIRLKESIDDVKEKTGSKQVIIIAHSMGGLVSRAYLDLFGDESVEKLIILGTPNQGIEADIQKYCTLTGAKNECEDMAKNSPFLQELNKEENKPRTTKIYTIAAVGCPTKNDEGGIEEGDGVVLKRSVALDYAEENYVIEGRCTDALQKDLHMNFVNTNMYPETYDLIKELLHEKK